MATITDVENELKVATKVKPKKGENRQDYLTRLADSVHNKMDEDEWESLSNEAQLWANNAAKATNSKKDLPEFDGSDDDEPDDESDEDEEAEEEEESEETDEEETDEEDTDEEEEPAPAKRGRPKGKGKAGKAAAKGKAKSAKGKSKAVEADEEDKPRKKRTAKVETRPAGAKVTKGPRGSGIKIKIKKFLLKDPKMPAEQIMERLSKGGGSPSETTVRAIRAEFRHTLKLLVEEGIIEEMEI